MNFAATISRCQMVIWGNFWDLTSCWCYCYNNRLVNVLKVSKQNETNQNKTLKIISRHASLSSLLTTFGMQLRQTLNRCRFVHVSKRPLHFAQVYDVMYWFTFILKVIFLFLYAFRKRRTNLLILVGEFDAKSAAPMWMCRLAWFHQPSRGSQREKSRINQLFFLMWYHIIISNKPTNFDWIFSTEWIKL